MISILHRHYDLPFLTKQILAFVQPEKTLFLVITINLWFALSQVKRAHLSKQLLPFFCKVQYIFWVCCALFHANQSNTSPLPNFFTRYFHSSSEVIFRDLVFFCFPTARVLRETVNAIFVTCCYRQTLLLDYGLISTYLPKSMTRRTKHLWKSHGNFRLRFIAIFDLISPTNSPVVGTVNHL